MKEIHSYQGSDVDPRVGRGFVLSRHAGKNDCEVCALLELQDLPFPGSIRSCLTHPTLPGLFILPFVTRETGWHRDFWTGKVKN